MSITGDEKNFFPVFPGKATFRANLTVLMKKCQGPFHFLQKPKFIENTIPLLAGIIRKYMAWDDLFRTARIIILSHFS